MFPKRDLVRGPVCGVLLLLGAAAAQAQEPGDPLVSDRPDFTESAVAVRPGNMVVRGG